jgi:hypothetical protein
MIWEDERAAPEERLGFVLHLGDFIYELVWYPEDRPQGMYDRRLRDIVRYPHGEKIRDFHIPTTRPVVGADRVSRLLAGVFAKLRGAGARIETVEVNGQPGAKLLDRKGRVFTVWALDIADGKVHCIRSVANPDKLRHLGPLSELLVRPLYTPQDETKPES